MHQTPDPIIDLTTPRQRTTVKMDSGTYRFRSHYDLTIEEIERVDRAMPRFLTLTDSEKRRSKKETDELVTLARDICRIGLLEGNPKTLGPNGLVVIADFFFNLCLQHRLRLGQVRESMVSGTKALLGDGSSPVSPSTIRAPRRSSGSPKSRSARSTH